MISYLTKADLTKESIQAKDFHRKKNYYKFRQLLSFTAIGLFYTFQYKSLTKLIFS